MNALVAHYRLPITVKPLTNETHRTHHDCQSHPSNEPFRTAIRKVCNKKQVQQKEEQRQKAGNSLEETAAEEKQKGAAVDPQWKREQEQERNQ